jgi:hypothetical protein
MGDMTKKHIVSIVLPVLILVSCGAPAPNNNYIPPQQVNEPLIAEITPTFESQIERVNNCDGTNSTYNVSFKTIQTQRATFEVTVGAGGLVTGTPIPSALEVQLEAKITAALAKDYGLTVEKGHDIKLDNPPGMFLEHAIEWKVSRAKGLIEVVYGDGVAQVVFDKIADVELYNRTSKSLGCASNSVNISPTTIPSLETEPPISGGHLASCSAFENGESRQVTSGTFVIGDIVIDGTKQHGEGDIGESTVAYFEKESTVLAQWGAGCYTGNKTLASQVIDQQLNEGYTRVRFVVVQSDGQQVVRFYDTQGIISSAPTCPSAGHLGAGKGFW